MNPKSPFITLESKPERLGGCWPIVIPFAAMAAYANSFSGAFVFDDQASIVDNRSIRHLASAFWPDHGSGQTVAGRPVLNLSLAFDYAFGRNQVWGYHLTNLLIHILAALTLFGLVRRTLQLPSLFPRFGRDAFWLAGLIALLWTVHPLQTESVSYVIQRAESLMGLFFLFTFYAFVRSLDSARPGLWRGLGVASFLLGIGTKEVIIAALPLLLLYDATFVSGSLSKAWRSHRGFFLALGSSLVFLGALVASGGGNRGGTIGLNTGVSPLAHVLTQPWALLTYLKLSLLPFPLIFEYGTFWAHPNGAFFLAAAGILLLLALTAVALQRAPALGFLGAWFFLILAPTSLAPAAAQMIVEHRMYLPLAAVLVLVVAGLHHWLGRRSIPLWLTGAALFGCLTAQRNQAYRTEETLWSDTVAKRPDNERAHNNLGSALAAEHRTGEAIAQYEKALRLKPDYIEAHNNLGIALSDESRIPEAMAEYETALRLKPDFADAHNNLGVELSRQGRVGEATVQYEEALRLKPDYSEAHYNLGNALRAAGRIPEAITQYEAVLRLQPDNAKAHFNLGSAFHAGGRIPEAVAQYEEVLRLQPDNERARQVLRGMGPGGPP